MLHNDNFSHTIQMLVALTATALILVAALLLAPSLTPPALTPGVMAPIHPEPAAGLDQVMGDIIVSPRAGLDLTTLRQGVLTPLLSQFGGNLVNTVTVGDQSFCLVHVAPENFVEAMSALSADGDFQLVCPNLVYHLDFSGMPNDPNLESQPQLRVHNVLKAYPLESGKPGEGGSGIKVGVVDTGVGGLQQDLMGRVTLGSNLVDGGFGNRDTDSSGFHHGTFIAAEIAASTNNKKLGAGIAYNAKIVPVNIYGSGRGSTTFTIIAAIGYCQKQGCRVINLSSNGRPPHTLNADGAYISACKQFYKSNNGLIFNSAGNDNAADMSSRNTFNLVIGGVDAALRKASFSNFGSALTFSGLAVSDGSSNASNIFRNANGTSFSAPACAAVAATIMGLHPQLSNQQVASLLTKNVIPLDSSMQLGYGVPDLAKSIRASANIGN